MQPKDFEICCRRLSALAEPNRLRIVHHLLTHGPTFVTEVAHEAGIDIVKASHHLKILLQTGIAKNQRQGKFIRYSLAPGIVKDGNVLDLGCCQIRLPIAT